MNKEYNPGFAFYDTYWKAIEYLPKEEIMENLYAMAKYGITGELVSQEEMPHGYSFVMSHRRNIDDSVNRWITNQARADFKTDQVISRDYQIAQLIAEGLNSKEIGERLDIDSSTVRKSQVWKDRKLDEFFVKYGVKNVNCDSQKEQKSQDEELKNVNLSQNFCEEKCEDVNFVRENSQNGTHDSQNFSQLLKDFPNF